MAKKDMADMAEQTATIDDCELAVAKLCLTMSATTASGRIRYLLNEAEIAQAKAAKDLYLALKSK